MEKLIAVHPKLKTPICHIFPKEIREYLSKDSADNSLIIILV